MPFAFTISNSAFITSGSAFAFAATGPDSLTLSEDGFLISQASGNGATLNGGPWTILNHGNITALGGIGLSLTATTATLASKITNGIEGNIYGSTYGVRSAHAVNISNKGTIFGSSQAAIEVSGSGDFTISNSGYVDGNTAAILLSGAGIHTISNSGTLFGATNGINATNAAGIEKVTNTGTIDGNVLLGGGDDVFINAGKGVVVFTNSTTKVVGMGQIDLGAGNDKFTGGTGADFVVDNLGDDTFTFGAGNDLFKASSVGASTESDKIDGSTGIDTLDYASAPGALTLNLDLKAHGSVDGFGFYGETNYAGSTVATATAGKDTIKNFENVKGSNLGDIIFGSKATNIIEGNGGDDDLWGFAGNDTLDGGAGIDFLIGGAGKDTLIGGADADNFIFLSIKDSGITAATRDLIRGFTGAGTTGGDLIGLSDIDAIAGTAANDAFTLLTNPNSKFTGTAGELRYEWVGVDTIIEGDVNGDRKADFSIAVEGAGLRFIASDFEL
jgi:Ca2+-binding RTX toxin-like protein